MQRYDKVLKHTATREATQQTFGRFKAFYQCMEELLQDFEAWLLPLLHELLNRLGLNPDRGTLLDRLLLVLLCKGAAVSLVWGGGNIVIALARHALRFQQRRRSNGDAYLAGSALQMVTIFVRALMVLAVGGIVLDLTVGGLVTMVSASAALIVLVFKDTVLGFVAGALLVRGNMLRPGDWIVLPGTVVQGQIEEIGTITVRLRNHDNTFHFVPTYSLLTRTFQNWSGMTERGVRMATLTLRLDAQSLRQLQPFLTWLQSFLGERPEVSREPFLLVRLSAADPYGLRVEVLYFLHTTAWAEVTQTESSILEAVIQKLPQYELRQYQYGV